MGFARWEGDGGFACGYVGGVEGFVACGVGIDFAACGEFLVAEECAYLDVG